VPITDKTLTPSGDLSAERSNRFFLISKTNQTLNIQWRALIHAQPTNCPISLEEITREKLEDLLLEFYKQAYPTGAKQG